MWQKAKFLDTVKSFAGKEIWVKIEAPQAVCIYYGIQEDGSYTSGGITTGYQTNVFDSVEGKYGYVDVRAVELLGNPDSFSASIPIISVEEWLASIVPTYH